MLIFPIFKQKMQNTGGRESQPKIDLYCERLAWQKCTIIKIILALVDFKNKLIKIFILFERKGAITLYKELKMQGFWRIFLYSKVNKDN